MNCCTTIGSNLFTKIDDVRRTEILNLQKFPHEEGILRWPPHGQQIGCKDSFQEEKDKFVWEFKKVNTLIQNWVKNHLPALLDDVIARTQTRKWLPVIIFAEWCFLSQVEV